MSFSVLYYISTILIIKQQKSLVGEVGLEPTKSKTRDLQSLPFAARVTLPKFVAGYSFQRQAFVLTVYGLFVRSYLRGTPDVPDLYPSLANTNR